MGAWEDEVTVFAKFEAPEDEGAIAVIFFPIVEPTQKPQASIGAWTQMSQNPTKQFRKCGIHKQQWHQFARKGLKTRSFLTLQALMVAKLKTEKAVTDGGNIMCKGKLGVWEGRI